MTPSPSEWPKLPPISHCPAPPFSQAEPCLVSGVPGPWLQLKQLWSGRQALNQIWMMLNKVTEKEKCMVHVCTGLFGTQAVEARSNYGRSVRKGSEVICPKAQCTQWQNQGFWHAFRFFSPMFLQHPHPLASGIKTGMAGLTAGSNFPLNPGRSWYHHRGCKEPEVQSLRAPPWALIQFCSRSQILIFSSTFPTAGASLTHLEMTGS